MVSSEMANNNGVKNIGANVRRLRDESGRSVIDLAAAAGIERNYWYEIERGDKHASVATLAAVARELKVGLDDLLVAAGKRRETARR